MGVAVLQPHDCLKSSPSKEPLISPTPNMKLPHPNHKPNRATRTHSNRPKRTHNSSHITRTQSTSNLEPQVNKLLMGQVKILKRGEQLTKTTPVTVKQEPRSTEPLTEGVSGLYAGYSMLVASPPPSSVPLPVFVTKKIAAVRDATTDLRKMLRLDFS